MTDAEIAVKLDKLASIEQDKIAALAAHPARAEYDWLLAQIADASAQLTAASLPFDARYADLKAEVEGAVMAHGATVKGEHLMAVFTRGRVTWDGKVLEGYVIAHPELAAARRVGQPGVAIRAVQNA